MRSVALCSLKGGVGKTTVALNLALALAKRGLRTVLIDASPSSDLPNCLREFGSATPGLVDVLAGASLMREALRETRHPGLSLLAASGKSPTASPCQNALGLRSALQSEVRWANALELLEPDFDIAIIDTAAENTAENRQLFSKLDYSLIPLQAEPLGLRSITRTLDFLGQVADAGPAPELLGFVLTMVNARNAISLDVAEEAWRRLPESLIFEATVLRHDWFLRASAEGVPLALLESKPPALVTAFEQIAAELAARLTRKNERLSDGPVRLMA